MDNKTNTINHTQQDFIKSQYLKHQYRSLYKMTCLLFVVFTVILSMTSTYLFVGVCNTNYLFWSEIGTLFNLSSVALCVAGNFITLSHYALNSSYYLSHKVAILWGLAIKAVLPAMLITGFICYLICSKKREHIKKSVADKYIRGARYAPPEILNELIQAKLKPGMLKIADVSVPEILETTHIRIMGAIGAGKTQAYYHIFTQVRDKGIKAFHYDGKPEYVGVLWREGDIIMCPFDKRCAAWNVWSEIQFDQDFERVGKAIVPRDPKVNDPHWADAGRVMFIAILRKLAEEKKMTNKDLYYTCSIMPLEELEELLDGTEAQSCFGDYANPQAVRNHMNNHVRAFKYMPDLDDGREQFSFSKWIHSDDNNWVFFVCREGDADALGPLISLWLSMISSSVLSLPDCKKRRIFAGLDELTDLLKVEHLEKLEKKGRSKGVCVVSGYQGPSQLDDIYNVKQSEALQGHFQTNLIFRCLEQSAPEMLSKMFGNTEVEEANISISGTKENREYSISWGIKSKRLIMPEEVQRLDNLECYMFLAGDFPLTKLKIPYKNYEQVTEPFITNQEAVDLFEQDYIDIEPQTLRKIREEI